MPVTVARVRVGAKVKEGEYYVVPASGVEDGDASSMLEAGSSQASAPEASTHQPAAIAKRCLGDTHDGNFSI